MATDVSDRNARRAQQAQSGDDNGDLAIAGLGVAALIGGGILLLRKKQPGTTPPGGTPPGGTPPGGTQFPAWWGQASAADKISNGVVALLVGHWPTVNGGPDTDATAFYNNGINMDPAFPPVDTAQGILPAGSHLSGIRAVAYAVIDSGSHEAINYINGTANTPAALVANCYAKLLGRNGNATEVAGWSAWYSAHGPASLIMSFCASDEFAAHVHALVGV